MSLVYIMQKLTFSVFTEFHVIIEQSDILYETVLYLCSKSNY